MNGRSTSSIVSKSPWLCTYQAHICCSNPTAFAVRRWNATHEISLQQLSQHDRTIIKEWPDARTLGRDLAAKRKEAKTSIRGIRYDELGQFLRTYNNFDINFRDTMRPEPVNTCIIFGTLHLVIDVSP